MDPISVIETAVTLSSRERSSAGKAPRDEAFKGLLDAAGERNEPAKPVRNKTARRDGADAEVADDAQPAVAANPPSGDTSPGESSTTAVQQTPSTAAGNGMKASENGLPANANALAATAGTPAQPHGQPFQAVADGNAQAVVAGATNNAEATSKAAKAGAAAAALAKPVATDTNAAKIQQGAEAKAVADVLRSETKADTDGRPKLVATQSGNGSGATPAVMKPLVEGATVVAAGEDKAPQGITTTTAAPAGTGAASDAVSDRVAPMGDPESAIGEGAKSASPTKSMASGELLTRAESPASLQQTQQTQQTIALRHVAPLIPAYEQVAVHVARAGREGIDQIRIQLDPAQLGRVDVRLEIGGDGRVLAVVAADRPETLDLLQRDSRALERALQDACLKTGSDSLSFQLRQQGGEGAQNGFSRRHGEGGGDAAGSEDGSDLPVAAPPKRRAVLDARLDISV